MSIKDNIAALKKKILDNKVVYLVFPLLIGVVLSFSSYMFFGSNDSGVVKSTQKVSTNIPTAKKDLVDDDITVYNEGYDDYEITNRKSGNELFVDSTLIRVDDVNEDELTSKDKKLIVMKNQEKLHDLIKNIEKNKKKRKSNADRKREDRERERRRKERLYRRQDSLERLDDERMRKQQEEIARIMAEAQNQQQNNNVSQMPPNELGNSSSGSSNIQESFNSSQGRTNRFNSVKNEDDYRLYKVEVYGDYENLITGSTIKLRLLEDLNKDGLILSRNTLIFGTLKIDQARIGLLVDNIIDGKIREVEFDLYDYDGARGINAPKNVQSEMIKRVQRKASRGHFIELPLVGRIGTNIFQGNDRTLKINIPNAYKLYLR